MTAPGGAPATSPPRGGPHGLPVGVTALTLAAAGLALVAALAGLFWPGGEGRVEVTSVRGQAVTLFGDGLYRYDTVFKAAGNLGTDVVTVLVGVPLLAFALVRARRGAPSGLLLLSGALVWPLYVYATLAVGTAFNSLFFVYVAAFSTSLFGLGLAAAGTDLAGVRNGADARDALATLPRRVLGVFSLCAAAITVFVWVLPLVGPVLQGTPPKLLGTNTTMVTEALDLAVITPLAVAAGVLVLRRRWVTGVRVVVPLLVLLVVLAPAIAAQTAFQVRAGVAFEPAEIIGPIGGFLVAGVVALVLLVRVVRAVDRA